MALIKIQLTEDHLKLLSQIRISGDDKQVVLDKYDLYYGDATLEQIAIILGKENEAIQSDMYGLEGKQFPDELADYMTELHEYICDNLQYIESIIHQFIFTGVKPGLYKAKDYELIWKFTEK